MVRAEGHLNSTDIFEDHVWPEVWTKTGKALQNREKQEWAKEKPKLDNARRLNGIYFIDPDDQDYKETLKMRLANRKDLWHSSCFVKELQNDITKVFAQSEIASQKTPKTSCG